MNKNIKNIIFDYGGILTGLDRNVCIDAFKNIGAADVAVYVEEARQEDLFYDLEIGNISVAEFCNEVRRLSKSDASDADICNAWAVLLSGIPSEKTEKLKSLTQNYNLYMLSNTNKIHWDYSLEKVFPEAGIDIDSIFRHTFLSYEMHMLKPSTDIFRKVVDEAGIDAGETVFIDDSASNCSAAESIGLNVIHAPKGTEWMDIFK